MQNLKGHKCALILSLCCYWLLGGALRQLRWLLLGAAEEGMEVFLFQALAAVIRLGLPCLILVKAAKVYELTACEKSCPVPVLFGAFFAIHYAVALLCEYIFSLFGEAAAEQLLPKTAAEILVYIAVQALLVPVLEELFFRKMLMGAFLPFGKAAAVSVSAAIFAAAHGSVAKFVPAFLCGLILGFVFMYDGDTKRSTLLHIFNNLLFCISSLLSAAGYEKQSGIILAVLCIAAGLPCLLYVIIAVLPKSCAALSGRDEEGGTLGFTSLIILVMIAAVAALLLAVVSMRMSISLY